MDSAVEASVEAFASRYAAAALAAPLLAWLAVAAAALGLWRIRAVASKSDAPPPPPAADPPAPRAPPGHVERPPRGHVEGDGATPRGRCTAYFHVEDNGEERDEEEEEDEEDNGETPLAGWTAVRRRRGDPRLGWYRYQDRTALTGNVVRLWGEDGCDGRIRATSPRIVRVRRRQEG